METKTIKVVCEVDNLSFGWWDEEEGKFVPINSQDNIDIACIVNTYSLEKRFGIENSDVIIILNPEAADMNARCICDKCGQPHDPKLIHGDEGKES